MCNAHNHPPGCTCGWGGDRDTGPNMVKNSNSNGLKWVDIKRYDSYVNPNAKCPVCGANVYYYRSEHDGRVFFDELGPPWPKHYCTNNSISANNLPLVKSDNHKNHAFWKQDGWLPITIENISKKSIYAFRLTRIDRYFSRYIDQMIYGNDAELLMKRDIIPFAKRKDNATIWLSIFDANKNESYEIELNHSELSLDHFFKNDHNNIFSWV